MSDPLAATRLPAQRDAEGAIVIDARGTFCPVPILEAAKVIARCEAVSEAWRVVVLADDPDAPEDFAEWANARGASSTCLELEKTGRPAWRLVLTPAGRLTPPSSFLPSCR